MRMAGIDVLRQGWRGAVMPPVRYAERQLADPMELALNVSQRLAQDMVSVQPSGAVAALEMAVNGKPGMPVVSPALVQAAREGQENASMRLMAEVYDKVVGLDGATVRHLMQKVTRMDDTGFTTLGRLYGGTVGSPLVSDVMTAAGVVGAGVGAYQLMGGTMGQPGSGE